MTMETQESISTIALVQDKPVAIQGFEGSFHQIAAQKFLGEDVPLSMCDSFPELFRQMEQQHAALGIMAIENSVAGSILPNYALLRNSDYKIIGEIYLRISHYLMALKGQKIEDIQSVHSHPMALEQCQMFLSQHQHIKVVRASDTAGSAKWIKENQLEGKAAIASELAASIYDLEVLAPSIETNQRNFTRFLVICQNPDRFIDKQLTNKASVCFNLASSSTKVGSLSQILIVLSSYGINLTKIQSLPIIGKEWEYFFHIDLEYDNYAKYLLSLDAIRPLVHELKVLGEYPRGEKVI